MFSVDPSPAVVPLQPAPPVLTVPRTWKLPAWFAVIQAILVSGIPTQIVVFLVLWLGFGLEPFENVNSLNISFEFIATLLLADTAVIAILIRVFLILSGEDSKHVFLGRRRPAKASPERRRDPHRIFLDRAKLLPGSDMLPTLLRPPIRLPRNT